MKTVIEKELAKRVTITENGKARQVPKLEVVSQRLVHDAMKGKQGAMNLLLGLQRDLFGANDSDDPTLTEIKQPDRAALRRIKKRLDQLFPDEDEERGDG